MNQEKISASSHVLVPIYVLSILWSTSLFYAPLAKIGICGVKPDRPTYGDAFTRCFHRQGFVRHHHLDLWSIRFDGIHCGKYVCQDRQFGEGMEMGEPNWIETVTNTLTRTKTRLSSYKNASLYVDTKNRATTVVFEPISIEYETRERWSPLCASSVTLFGPTPMLLHGSFPLLCR